MEEKPIDKYNYADINAKAIDTWVEGGWEWGIPVSHEEYSKAANGDWGVYLTPTRTVPKEWFHAFKGAKLLGLASGGGQQMPIFASLGADCTVLDYSDKQLESERMVSRREGYAIDVIKADMTKTLPFEDNSFDMIFHPVSNCYIEDVYHVWNECFRILKKGGVLLAGMDNGMNFLIEENKLPLTIVNKLPVNPLKDLSPEEYKKRIDTNESIQFSHSLEEQLGGQLKAGLVITDLYEDRDNESSGAVLREYTPQYIATRAVKLSDKE